MGSGSEASGSSGDDLLLLRRRFGCFFDVVPEVAKHLRRALDQAASWCARPERPDLLLNIVLVPREACPEFRHLTSDDESEGEDAQEGEQHDSDHRGGSRDPPTAERGDHRRECEAEKPCERKRHENVAPEVEGSDDHHQDRQRLHPSPPLSWQNVRVEHRSRRRRTLIHCHPCASRLKRNIATAASRVAAVAETGCDTDESANHHTHPEIVERLKRAEGHLRSVGSAIQTARDHYAAPARAGRRYGQRSSVTPTVTHEMLRRSWRTCAPADIPVSAPLPTS